MGKINCRGHENRIELCNHYIIKPEFRIKMLKGIVVSDAGGRITDELYIFSAYDKQTGEFYDKITCGEPTAKDFLLITGDKKPELFNMLKAQKKNLEAKNPQTIEKTNQSKKKTARNVQVDTDILNWHPVNRALYEALMVLIVVWNDTSGDSLLFRELKKCTKYPDKYPYSDRLMRLNTMLSKDRRKTLANILESLKKSGNDLKDFDLELLHEAVEKTGVKSNIK